MLKKKLIKKKLHEELIIFNKKKLLSEVSLNKIKNPLYVEHILGVNKLLYENDYKGYNDLIIERQIVIENILTSIDNFIGKQIDKGKQVALTFIDGIKNTKDLIIFFKNIMLNPELMADSIKRVENKINETKNKITESLKTISNKLKNNPVVSVIDNIIKMFENLLSKINNDGWVGFLSKLIFCVGIVWLNQNFLVKLSTMSLDKLIEQIKSFESVQLLFTNITNITNTIGSVVDINEVIKKILSFGTGVEIIGYAIDAIAIIKLIHEILIPVVNDIKTKFNLAKN
jgi:hypothetical protein